MIACHFLLIYSAWGLHTPSQPYESTFDFSTSDVYSTLTTPPSQWTDWVVGGATSDFTGQYAIHFLC